MTTLLIVLASFATTAAWAGGPKILYNIPAGDASKTLHIYLQQTPIEMLYLAEKVRGRRTNAVSGNLEASEALERMLEGTDLKYSFTADFSFATVKTREELQSGSDEPRVDVATASTRQMESRAQTESMRALFGDQKLEEVLVTGTLIRGVVDMTSPLEFVTKKELKKTPYATVQDALQALPVNMGSTFNEAFGGTGNYARGVAANLRGLGAGATLVLINGHRQAYSGIQADFVDLSNIPWSAVERIEVLPDGASALYGSDAIAGVVNVIMRQDVSGAETQARYGFAQGGADQRLISQSFGTSWDDGNALISYQYSERTVLATSARDYTANEDQRPLGGTDHRSISSNPGNILDPATFLPAYAIPSGQPGASLTVADLISGSANLENRNVDSDLLPDRKAHSLYLNANQKLGDRFELFGDARFNRSDVRQIGNAAEQILRVPSTNAFAGRVNPYGGVPFVVVGYSFQDDLGQLETSADVRSYAGTFGAKARMGDTWSLNLSGTRGSEILRFVGGNLINFSALSAALADPDPATAFNPFGDGSNTNPATVEKIRLTQRDQSRSQISSVNFVADGTLMKWETGSLRLAAGGEWRSEGLEKSSMRGTTLRPSVDVGRTVRSAFAELSVPLIGQPNDARAVPRLELSLAGRYEEYSDFGTTANPKIGLRWVPFDALKLRGSWGTSFRAPKLADVYDSSTNAASLALLRDPLSPAGSSIVLVREGSNPDLREEVAQTWTAGVDFAPGSIPGLGISLTYYSISYNDRIVVPGPTPLTDILSQGDKWTTVINRQPTREEINSVCESPAYAGGGVAQCESASVGAIVDLRLRNLAVTRVKGLDLKVDRSLTTDLGTFDFGLNGGYVLSFRQAASNALPTSSVLNTVGNPTALRMRGTADWYQYGFDKPGFGASLTIDRFGGYEDVQSLSRVSVSPLTTVDLKASYRTLSGNGLLDDLEFSLNGSNLLNAAPPFVDRSLGFDTINAQPYGRVISFGLQKRW
ncbi:MAG: TonB-dependent receptor [Gammaproteobacteria bacterium]